MIIIPAIDLKDGKVVRLLRGEYQQETVYDENPLAVARRWKYAGADIIHIVNLDGALAGDLKQLEIVKKLISNLHIQVQFGGGIRSLDDIKSVFDAGAERVIIGTKAFTDDTFLKYISQDPILKNKLDNIIVSIDCKRAAQGSYVATTTGWTQDTQITHVDMLDEISKHGITTAVVTDISTDGALTGPNMPFLTQALEKNSSVKIIASGGIANIDNIKELKALSEKYTNLHGVIIGKALYEQKVELKEAIRVCR
ncbi:MAG: 1-(5-phosphoribosyl)-5-[(5-phosphoribosylamino)methylideneamino]imidazole-4-carboxamide isomerase [PVC group bacterium]|nr:1-(5-phosphoribosyl)-5-[(5-phosphoribosylamino)methylideneamino]imidazole-4-carboxamide isomerase [PVC group bacterium]